MKEQIITFETAKLAKEKGFCIKYNCCQLFFTDNKNGMYENEPKIVPFEHHTWILAPTQSLLQRWLREEHNIVVLIERLEHQLNPLDNLYYPHVWGREFEPEDVHHSDSYEYSLESGLVKALKLIKN
jgi:hypothetical protein